MIEKFRGENIRTKLLAAFLLMSAIGLVLGVIGLFSISTLTRMSNELNKLQLESKGITDVLNRHYIWRQNLTETVLFGSAFTGELDSKSCSLGKWLEEKEAKAITDDTVLSMLDDISEPHDFVHHAAGIIVRYMQAERLNAARELLLESVLPKTHEVITGLEQMKEHYAESIDHKTIDIISTGRLFTIFIVVFILVAVVTGVLMGIFLLMLVSRTIIKPLTVLSSKVRQSAQDMLSVSSRMADSSKGLNGQTSVVSAATEEFSVGMTQSANSLSTASSHISAVASSIEEINSTINTVAAAAEETSTRVEQSSALVDSIQNSISKASGSVTLVSNAFNSVAESVNEINKSILVVSEHSVTAMNKMSAADEKAKNTNLIIQRLEAASKQIGKIVSVISDIADQTNMLALNAAIEAAGAGEAGKGFMVVANEVKELAKQTAGATNEIADHIENMQKNMPEAVGAVSEIGAIINGMAEFMNSFAQEIAQQGKRSDQIADESAAAARRMSEITTEINKISENALSVTKTVVDSTKGVNEIARSTADLVGGSQEIAMNSERASNNMSEINGTAREMASGLTDISRNIQLINEEAKSLLEGADSAKLSSEEFLKAASDMEEFISKFKTN